MGAFSIATATARPIARAVSEAGVGGGAVVPPFDGGLLLNGSFDTDTVWIKGTNWSISGGKATRTAIVSITNLEQIFDPPLPAGTYKFEYEVDSISGGAVTFRLTDGTATYTTTNHTTPGVKSGEVFIATDCNKAFFLASTNAVVSLNYAKLNPA